MLSVIAIWAMLMVVFFTLNMLVAVYGLYVVKTKKQRKVALMLNNLTGIPLLILGLPLLPITLPIVFFVEAERKKAYKAAKEEKVKAYLAEKSEFQKSLGGE